MGGIVTAGRPTRTPETVLDQNQSARRSVPSPYCNRRLAIVTDIASPYRIPVFNSIDERIGEELRVFFMALRSTNRSWHVPIEKAAFHYQVLRGFAFSGSPDAFPHYLNPGVGRALRAFQPHVVIVGGYNHPTSFLAALAAKRLRARLVLWCESTVRDGRSGTRVVERIKARFMRSCDAFVVPGRASRQYLVAYGMDDRKIVTAPNAVDAEFFTGEAARLRGKGLAAASREGGPFSLLFVGRLSPEKGIPVLLEVVRRLQQRGVEIALRIVGDGPTRGEYEASSARLGLRAVEFLGFRQQPELPSHYVASDLLVVPSVSEPWGLVVNEAMACGVPVVCSENVGAAYDLVDEGVTGFICKDIGDYVRVISKSAASPELLATMGKASAAKAIGFSPAACAAGFLAVLNG